MQEDLTYGTDVRGDDALFIEEKHFLADGWTVDQEATDAVRGGETFFRVIDVNGVEQHGHGWVDSDGNIVQWG